MHTAPACCHMAARPAPPMSWRHSATYRHRATTPSADPAPPGVTGGQQPFPPTLYPFRSPLPFNSTEHLRHSPPVLLPDNTSRLSYSDYIFGFSTQKLRDRLHSPQNEALHLYPHFATPLLPGSRHSPGSI